MDRERAETYLRQLAEAELRRAATPGARDADRTGSLPLVAHALITAGAIDVDTADEVLAGFELAEAARWPAEGGAAALRRARLTWVRPRRDATGPSAGSRRPDGCTDLRRTRSGRVLAGLLRAFHRRR